MTRYEFDQQILRLNKTFKNFYTEERISILWKAYEKFPHVWFTKMCDYFIANYTTPPKGDDFTKLASEQRLAWKAKQVGAPKEFPESDLPDDEIKDRSRMILERLQGKVPDKDWDDFNRFLKDRK
jgi:hypothetical protein